MFKKKKKIQPTANPAINNRIERLHESTFTLEMQVFDTYATIFSAILYPENTPDRKKADHDAEIARTCLLSSIAGYDDIRADLLNEAQRLNIKLPFCIPNSHSIIEQIMKRIICGNAR